MNWMSYEFRKVIAFSRPFLNILDWGSNSITSNTWGEFNTFLKSFIHINELRIYLKLYSYFKYMYITHIFFANNFADNAWDSNHSIFHQTGNCTKLPVEQHVLLPAESLCCFSAGQTVRSQFSSVLCIFGISYLIQECSFMSLFRRFCFNGKWSQLI